MHVYIYIHTHTFVHACTRTQTCTLYRLSTAILLHTSPTQFSTARCGSSQKRYKSVIAIALHNFSKSSSAKLLGAVSNTTRELPQHRFLCFWSAVLGRSHRGQKVARGFSTHAPRFCLRAAPAACLAAVFGSWQSELKVDAACSQHKSSTRIPANFRIAVFNIRLWKFADGALCIGHQFK